jgi:hypothetical protein
MYAYHVPIFALSLQRIVFLIVLISGTFFFNFSALLVEDTKEQQRSMDQLLWLEYADTSQNYRGMTVRCEPAGS